MPNAKQLIKSALQRVGVTRDRAAFVRMFAERQALALASGRPRPTGRILCYHSVGQPSLGVNDISEARFRAQIEDALARGYRFRLASDIARDGGEPNDLAITFDDAWSSVRDVVAPVLRGYGVPWTLFAVSDWSETPHEWRGVTTLGWRDLEALAASGVELGSHSMTHPNFGALPTERVRDELVGSRDAFARRLGFAPATFGIPLGQSMNWNEACAAEAAAAGYEIVYAQAENTRPPGTVPRTFVTCFDNVRLFRAALAGSFDTWEEWY